MIGVVVVEVARAVAVVVMAASVVAAVGVCVCWSSRAVAPYACPAMPHSRRPAVG